MKVSDRMRRGVITVSDDEDLAVAVRLMLANAIHHLPVVRGGRLVGVLTPRNVLVHRGEVGWPINGVVSDAMTHPIETISPSAPLETAASRMASKNVTCLVVVERDAIVGILTCTDLLAALSRVELERVRGEREWAMVVATR